MMRALTLCLASISIVLTLFGADARGATPERTIELVQFCADSAQSASAIHDHASAQGWWRLDRRAFADLQNSTHIAVAAERGWLADETGMMLTVGTEGPRLAALGDPLDAGEPTLPTQACTVYSTRVDVHAVAVGLQSLILLGTALGPPTDQTDAGSRSIQTWVIRREGEVAYVYAEFAGAVVIVEVGRVVSAP